MYKIFDLHNDYFLSIANDNKKSGYIKRQESADTIVSAVWTSELNEMESFSMLDKARSFVNRNEKLFLGVEDLHFISKDNLERFVGLRPVYAGLTWNNANALAGGAHESGRLTTLGKKVICELERNDIIIDLAHLNEESFIDVTKNLTKPLFCSHTAFRGLCDNQRNLKDYQIKTIIDSGGLVGLCLVSLFINGTNKCEVKDIVCHIDYFACRFGIENLAIGTDFYGTKHLPRKIKDYESLSKELSKELLKLGYTEKSIRKILFENANRFFRKVG